MATRPPSSRRRPDTAEPERGRRRRALAMLPWIATLILLLALGGAAGWVWWQTSQAPVARIAAVLPMPKMPPPAPPVPESAGTESGNARTAPPAAAPAMVTPPPPQEHEATPEPAPTTAAPATTASASVPAPPATTSTTPAPRTLAPPTLATQTPAAQTPAAQTPAPKSPAPASPEPPKAAAKAPGQAEPPKAPPPKAIAEAPPAAAPAPAPAKPRREPRITLGPVPDPALVSKGPQGPLPVIAPDGRQAWHVYARPFADPDKRPRVAIMLGDLGLSEPATNAAIQQLPSPVTLGFAPYAPDLQGWIAKARAAGHEVMLQLPMEPLDYPANDPGPHALLTNLSVKDNLQRLDWQLSRVTGYIGVTNYMGSKFTTMPDEVRPILEALRSRGLMFLDSRSSQRSVAARIAGDIGLPRAENNRFLDNEASRGAIDARLEELERIARKTGTAVGIGYPYPVTIERVAAWAETLPAKGLVLAPVSAIANRQVVE